MILISHRGNLSGADPKTENHPDQICRALAAGFDVEVDVWFVDGKWFLGHDKPQYEVKDLDFSWRRSHIWAHAKNLDALYQLATNHQDGPYYWHQEDAHALTSNGFIWAYPGQQLTPKSIWVMPERSVDIKDIRKHPECSGICSDFILHFGTND